MNKLDYGRPSKAENYPPVTQLLFIFAVASYLTFPITGPEFFFHLTLGHYLRAFGEFPQVDLWSAVGQEKFFQPNAWLFAYILGFLEDATAGGQGLVYFRLASSLLFVALLTYAFSKRAKNLFFGSFVAAVVSAACLESMDFRPLILTLPLMLLAITLAENLISFRTQAFLLLILALLANTSVNYFLIAFFVAIYLRPYDRMRLLTLGVLLVVPVVLGPFSVKQASNEFLASIEELKFALLLRTEIASIYDFKLAFLCLVWLFAGTLFRQNSARISRAELIICASISLLSLLFQPLLYLALVATGLALSRMWSNAKETNSKGLYQACIQLAAKLGKLPASGLFFLLLCISIASAIRFFRFPISYAFMPQQAMDYVLEKKLPGPIFHEAAVGSYVAFRLANAQGLPNARVAWDQRTELFQAPELKSSLALNTLSSGWNYYFDKLNPKTVICRRQTAFCGSLVKDKNWIQHRDISSDVNGDAYQFWAVFERRSDT